MENSFLTVEYLSNINKVLKHTFHSMQRIKLTCFDVSASYLIIGTSSGGIYIFKKDPCEFLKLIPSRDGSARFAAISPDERHIGVVSSRGLILILQNFIGNTNIQNQVFSEHEGQQVTYIKWHRHELYVGDETGKVSVVSVVADLFQSKSIFQIPSATLMTVDSPIVQIDAYQSLLLISTQTKTYLCNTQKETFVQLGKKLRNGCFGACFSASSNDAAELSSVHNNRKAFQSVEENEIVLTGENHLNTKIFCARPGARLWEVGFDAKVIVTHQFKGALNEVPSEILVIGSEEESSLQKIIYGANQTVTEDSFHFHHVFSVCDTFVLTYDSEKLYIFDPGANKIFFWTALSSGIKQVAIINNEFYIWKNNLEIIILSVVHIERLMLDTLFKKQYHLCIDLCLELKDKILHLLESSKKLYLLSVLKSKVNSDELRKSMQCIFDKIKDTNERTLTRSQKGNIVLVGDQYARDEASIAPTKVPPEDGVTPFKLLLKQYKLNKTHQTIEIPEVRQSLQSVDPEQLLITLKQFKEHVNKNLDEDATEWCQYQYLKNISNRCIVVKDLPDESVEFLTKSLIAANEALNYSCLCGYPLPKCHKYPPHFYKTALEILQTAKNVDRIIKKVPYLWRHRLKTELHGLNMTALIQFSNLELFIDHTMELTYDSWHDILGYFVKLNKGVCLNCNRAIDIESIFTWTQVGKVSIQSLGAKNALRILEKYYKVIPNGALDTSFYQTCIFTHTLINDNSTTKVNPRTPYNFVEQLNKSSKGQFQDALANYFQRKYLTTKNSCFDFGLENPVACFLCNLPLKNDILFDREVVKSCGHRFHKFCFERNDKVCNICD